MCITKEFAMSENISHEPNGNYMVTGIFRLLFLTMMFHKWKQLCKGEQTLHKWLFSADTLFQGF